MIKHAKWFIVPVAFMLLVGCGNSEESSGDKENVSDEADSKFGEDFSGYITTDKETGCKYIRAGGYSSWTYVHGSCPDVIAKENGVTYKEE